MTPTDGWDGYRAFVGEGLHGGDDDRIGKAERRWSDKQTAVPGMAPATNGPDNNANTGNNTTEKDNNA